MSFNNANNAGFDSTNCGTLRPGERCELRKKRAGEVYGAYIYEIFTEGSQAPTKIRKLATSIPAANGYMNLETFRGIQHEGRTYEALRGLAEFEKFCLPFLQYRDEDTRRFIDFEYVPGETAQDYIHRQGLSRALRKVLLAQSLQALRFLAANGFVHGDIKLDNFWWDSEAKRVRVFDLELARKTVAITDRHSPVSLVNEMDRVVNLLEMKGEFGFSKGETEEILGATRTKLLEFIGKSETKEEGLARLIEVYTRAIARLSSGGGRTQRLARRSTRRKNRRNK